MKYDIAALKRKMLVKYPFFGSVVASVGYKENKDIPTAGTDGETIYYNPEYLESLSDISDIVKEDKPIVKEAKKRINKSKKEVKIND